MLSECFVQVLCYFVSGSVAHLTVISVNNKLMNVLLN